MNPEEINRLCEGSFIDLLNIRFTVFEKDRVRAVMKITPRHFQPMGVVHGGALISLAETVGSAGSFALVDPGKFNVYGAAVDSQHLAPARQGELHAVARLTVKLESKHVWDVEIRDDQGKLISISRVTNSIKPRN
ncbi:MAG: PaaI family thioesterase [Bacteroidales bacterium]